MADFLAICLRMACSKARSDGYHIHTYTLACRLQRVWYYFATLRFLFSWLANDIRLPWLPNNDWYSIADPQSSRWVGCCTVHMHTAVTLGYVNLDLYLLVNGKRLNCCKICADADCTVPRYAYAREQKTWSMPWPFMPVMMNYVRFYASYSMRRQLGIFLMSNMRKNIKLNDERPPLPSIALHYTALYCTVLCRTSPWTCMMFTFGRDEGAYPPDGAISPWLPTNTFGQT